MQSTKRTKYHKLIKDLKILKVISTPHQSLWAAPNPSKLSSYNANKTAIYPSRVGASHGLPPKSGNRDPKANGVSSPWATTKKFVNYLQFLLYISRENSLNQPWEFKFAKQKGPEGPMGVSYPKGVANSLILDSTGKALQNSILALGSNNLSRDDSFGRGFSSEGIFPLSNEGISYLLGKPTGLTKKTTISFFPYSKSFICYWLLPFMGFFHYYNFPGGLSGTQLVNSSSPVTMDGVEAAQALSLPQGQGASLLQQNSIGNLSRFGKKMWFGSMDQNSISFSSHFTQRKSDRNSLLSGESSTFLTNPLNQNYTLLNTISLNSVLNTLSNQLAPKNSSFVDESSKSYFIKKLNAKKPLSELHVDSQKTNTKKLYNVNNYLYSHASFPAKGSYIYGQSLGPGGPKMSSSLKTNKEMNLYPDKINKGSIVFSANAQGVNNVAHETEHSRLTVYPFSSINKRKNLINSKSGYSYSMPILSYKKAAILLSTYDKMKSLKLNSEKQKQFLTKLSPKGLSLLGISLSPYLSGLLITNPTQATQAIWQSLENLRRNSIKVSNNYTMVGKPIWNKGYTYQSQNGQWLWAKHMECLSNEVYGTLLKLNSSKKSLATELPQVSPLGSPFRGEMGGIGNKLTNEQLYNLILSSFETSLDNLYKDKQRSIENTEMGEVKDEILTSKPAGLREIPSIGDSVLAKPMGVGVSPDPLAPGGGTESLMRPTPLGGTCAPNSVKLGDSGPGGPTSSYPSDRGLVPLTAILKLKHPLLFYNLYGVVSPKGMPQAAQAPMGQGVPLPHSGATLLVPKGIPTDYGVPVSFGPRRSTPWGQRPKLLLPHLNLTSIGLAHSSSKPNAWGKKLGASTMVLPLNKVTLRERGSQSHKKLSIFKRDANLSTFIDFVYFKVKQVNPIFSRSIGLGQRPSSVVAGESPNAPNPVKRSIVLDGQRGYQTNTDVSNLSKNPIFLESLNSNNNRQGPQALPERNIEKVFRSYLSKKRHTPGAKRLGPMALKSKGWKGHYTNLINQIKSVSGSSNTQPFRVKKESPIYTYLKKKALHKLNQPVKRIKRKSHATFLNLQRVSPFQNSTFTSILKNRAFIVKSTSGYENSSLNKKYGVSYLQTLNSLNLPDIKKVVDKNNSYFLTLESRKNQQKKYRRKKQCKETRDTKKRKRFYPRSSWARFRLYKNLSNNLSAKKIITMQQISNNVKIGQSPWQPLAAQRPSAVLEFKKLSSKLAQPISMGFPHNGLWTLYTNKDFYFVSQSVIGEFKRAFWKSYWLRSNLKPYLNRIKNELKDLKSSKTKWEIYLNLRSFLLWTNSSFSDISFLHKGESPAGLPQRDKGDGLWPKSEFLNYNFLKTSRAKNNTQVTNLQSQPKELREIPSKPLPGGYGLTRSNSVTTPSNGYPSSDKGPSAYVAVGPPGPNGSLWTVTSQALDPEPFGVSSGASQKGLLRAGATPLLKPLAPGLVRPLAVTEFSYGVPTGMQHLNTFKIYNNAKWQDILQLAEHNKVMYDRIQQIIFNIKENLNINGQFKARPIHLGHQKWGISDSTTVLNANKQNINNNNNNFWSKIGKTTSSIFAPKFQKNSNRAYRLYWAIHKSNLGSFERNNADHKPQGAPIQAETLNKRAEPRPKDLWTLSTKDRDQSKNNKTKKLLLNLSTKFNDWTSQRVPNYNAVWSTIKIGQNPSFKLQAEKMRSPGQRPSFPLGIEAERAPTAVAPERAPNEMSSQSPLFAEPMEAKRAPTAPEAERAPNETKGHGQSTHQNINRVNLHKKSPLGLLITERKQRQKEQKLNYLGLSNKNILQQNAAVFGGTLGYGVGAAPAWGQRIRLPYSGAGAMHMVNDKEKRLSSYNYSSTFSYWWKASPLKLNIIPTIKNTENISSPFTKNTFLTTPQRTNFFWASTFIFHFCAFVSLISISQVRDYIKFCLIVLSKMSPFLQSTIYIVSESSTKLYNKLAKPKFIFDLALRAQGGKPGGLFSRTKFSNSGPYPLAPGGGWGADPRASGLWPTQKFLKKDEVTELGQFPKGILGISLSPAGLVVSPLGLGLWPKPADTLKAAIDKAHGSLLGKNNLVNSLGNFNIKKGPMNGKRMIGISLSPTGLSYYMFISLIQKPLWEKGQSNLMGGREKPVGLKPLPQGVRSIAFGETPNIVTPNVLWAKDLTPKNLAIKKAQTLSSIFLYYTLNSLAFSMSNLSFLTYQYFQKSLNVFETFVRSIYAFLEKPGELILDWVAYFFLVEWSSDLTKTIPDTVYSVATNTYMTKFSRSLLYLPYPLWNTGFTTWPYSGSTSQSMSIGSASLSPLGVRSPLTLNFLSILSGSLIQRRILSIYQIFLNVACRPDTDIMQRQQKGHIFMDIWSDLLIDVALYSNINISECSNSKEEQNRLLEQLLQYNINSSNLEGAFTNGVAPTPTSNKVLYGVLGAKHLPPAAQAPMGDSGATPLVPKGIPTDYGVSNGQRPKLQLPKWTGYGNGLSPWGLQKSNLQNNFPGYFYTQFFQPGKGHHGLRSWYSSNAPAGQKSSTSFTNTFTQGLWMKSRSSNNKWKRWSANQFCSYQGKDTELFIDLHPPKSFAGLTSIKYSKSIQQPIATLVGQVFSGIFYKQISKNLLVIGSNPRDSNSTTNTSTPYAYDQKSLLIQAIAGETELKIITDSAHRYAMVYRGVAVGIKLLRDVFEALTLHTPCIFLLEDIHAIGERRPFLISDNPEGEGKGNEFGSDRQADSHEKNQIIYQLTKHLISHYKKPYKGDFSLLIPTNHFCFSLFSDSQASKSISSNRGLSLSPITNTPISLSPGAQGLNSSTQNEKTGVAPLGMLSTSLQLPKNIDLAPPATSPFSVLVLKEEKKFKPRKIVKELSWGGLPGEQLANVSKSTYSVRVKVAILADMVLSNLSVKLDMITDLLVIIDSVKGNHGFAVFATTHVPYVLDPALRRPGRFDETISLGGTQIPSLLSRMEILKSNLINLSGDGRRPKSINYAESGSMFPIGVSFAVTDFYKHFSQLLSTQNTYNSYVYSGIVNSIISGLSPIAPMHSSLWSYPHSHGLRLGQKPFGLKAASFKDLSKLANGQLASQAPRPTLVTESPTAKGLTKEIPTKPKGLTPKLLLARFGQKIAPFGHVYNHISQILIAIGISENSPVSFGPRQGKKWPASGYGVGVSSYPGAPPRGLPYAQTEHGPKVTASAKSNSVGLFNLLHLDSLVYTILYSSPNIFKQHLTILMAGKLGELFTYSGALALGVSPVSSPDGSKGKLGVTPSPSMPVPGAKVRSTPWGQVLASSSSDGLGPKPVRLSSSKPLGCSPLGCPTLGLTNNSVDGQRPKSIEGIGLMNLSGVDKTWQTATALIFSFIQKRWLYQKNLLIPKFLDFGPEGYKKDIPSPPSSNILLPARRYENYKRTFIYSKYRRKTELSITDKIVLHQQQRLVKRLYNIPLKEYFRSEIFSRALNGVGALGIGFDNAPSKPKTSVANISQLNSFANASIVLAGVENKQHLPTSINHSPYKSSNWYFRNRILNRHYTYLSNQWWNGQLQEHNSETTFLSDIDWRYSYMPQVTESPLTGQASGLWPPGAKGNLKDAWGNSAMDSSLPGVSNLWQVLGQPNGLPTPGAKPSKSQTSPLKEAMVDFPDAEQFYNHKTRRWINTNGSWNYWFDYSSMDSTNYKNSYVFECLTNAYKCLDQNRELLDYYVISVLEKGKTLNEFEIISFFKRF